MAVSCKKVDKGEDVLRKLFRTLLILLIVGAAATTIKALFFFRIQKPGDPQPCFSREQAKNEGFWVRDVTVQPNTFQSGGKTYRLGEDWIEEAFEDDDYRVWFSKRTKLGWNRLCLRVPRYEDGAIELDYFDGGYAGSVFLYSKKLESGQYPTIQLHVRFKSWNSDEKIELETVVLKPN
ncbi:MAG: hypothetical protein JNJ77_11175 [Planctomycetia bacterium]|nr:hypothetical protein [Planctomycetia bacterium]